MNNYKAIIAAVALLISLSATASGTADSAAPATYRHANEDIGTVRQVYDGKLYPDIQVNTFRNIDRLFPSRTVARGSVISQLPLSPQPLNDFAYSVDGQTYDLYDVLSMNRVSGLLILHHGAIVFEQYLLGNGPDTRWMSMSVVKSITATLIGAAIQDGLINSIDDPIVNYLPRFNGTAYDGVTVKHLLKMSSGVAWNETYTDPASDRRRMLEAQLSQQPGAILDLMASLPRAAAPGTLWNYSTGETQLAGALVRAATGKPVAQYLSEKIWSKLGMQADASWWLQSPDGLEIGGSGLSATLRDYARLGLFWLNDGVIHTGGKTQRVLPPGWMQAASSRQLIGGKTVDYGYMLWPMHGSSYAAEGIFGQYLFVDPDKQLVVAMWSAQSKPLHRAALDEYAFLQALSARFN
ncbi:MAG: beta-lactamase family protein [Gammaproteobacteria bacterium]|nr:beta-lactamase family protein [Gammaproteobacteria bacterium]MBU1554109.1 beta-lactamase family protein [Gammaproteobacteria bacterium]MBU2072209.1 beta-lactamase family protein [Gammaproteobacteria bacterium]MBU2182071.1 beta-lactamase family protein [Gammaproteobacteria bacterium]MBU2203914.1 beta-lactamase family protein [Gammaproteobacteria bacterium]